MHLGGLEDDREDTTAPHITFRPQMGGHRHCGPATCTFHLGFSLGFAGNRCPGASPAIWLKPSLGPHRRLNVASEHRSPPVGFIAPSPPVAKLPRLSPRSPNESPLPQKIQELWRCWSQPEKWTASIYGMSTPGRTAGPDLVTRWLTLCGTSLLQ